MIYDTKTEALVEANAVARDIDIYTLRCGTESLAPIYLSKLNIGYTLPDGEIVYLDVKDYIPYMICSVGSSIDEYTKKLKKTYEEAEAYLNEYLGKDIKTLTSDDVHSEDFYASANIVIHHELLAGHYMKAFVTMKKIFAFYKDIKAKATYDGHEYTTLYHTMSYLTSVGYAKDQDEKKYLISLAIITIKALLEVDKSIGRSCKEDITSYISYFKSLDGAASIREFLSGNRTLASFHRWIMGQKSVQAVIRSIDRREGPMAYAVNDNTTGFNRYNYYKYNSKPYEDEQLIISLITSDEEFVKKVIVGVRKNLKENTIDGYGYNYYTHFWYDDSYSELHKILSIVKNNAAQNYDIMADFIKMMKLYLTSTYAIGSKHAGIIEDVKAIKSILEFLNCGDHFYEVVGDLPEKIQGYALQALI